MVKNIKGRFKLFLIIVFALFLSYIITVFANTSRIIVSIQAQEIANIFLPKRPHLMLHNLVGVTTNVIFLIVIYYLTNKLLKFYKQ